MNKLRWIVIINLIIGMCAVSGCDKIGGVSKNMETLAKVLYASSRNAFGGNNYIFEKMEVIEVGKDLGQGMPVKFKLNGIRGYKTQSSPPPGWVSGARAWIGDFIEIEEKFDETFIVFYTKNEFGKLLACIEGGVYCVSEENMEQHRAKLENMVTQHQLAKEQDTKRQVEYAQQQASEEVSRQKQSQLEQLRVQARVPSVILGTYPCINHVIGMAENPPAQGKTVLTDVDVSYVFVNRYGEPDPVKVVFSFDNITGVEKTNSSEGIGYVHFRLRNSINTLMNSRGGHIGDYIYFSDIAIRDAFLDQLIEAIKTWGGKHPELTVYSIK